MELFQPIREEVILREDLDSIIDFLKKIPEEYPEELTAGIGSLFLLGNVILFFYGAAEVIAAFKTDLFWSKKLNAILNTNNWKVHIVKDNYPSAFAMTGPHVFITTGLLKIATENEIIAILLHEAYHTKKNHAYRELAYEFPLFYLCSYASVTAGAATGNIWFGLIASVITYYAAFSVSKILYKITIARMEENQADNYAIQMGYGKDLASIMKKFEKMYLKSMKNCTGMCRIINAIDESIDEHPVLKKRIETILRKTGELSDVLKTKDVKKIAKFIIGSPREYGQTVKR